MDCSRLRSKTGRRAVTDKQREVLRAFARRVIPGGDGWPDGAEAECEDYVSRLLAGDWAHKQDEFLAGLERLADAEFAELAAAAQDALLAEFATGEQAGWFRDANALVAENYYSDASSGAHGPEAGWPMMSYSPAIKRPTRAHTPAELAEIAPEQLRERYDAVVIGAGAGGGVVACQLAEAGKTVLLVERGSWRPQGTVGSDHLRNHRLSRYGINGGPALAGNPRVVIGEDGTRRVLQPNHGGWSNNAQMLGGGTRLYGAQAWRFLAKDFRMASDYGVPKGSSLADWPISYEELAPHYAQAEAELGVCGVADSAFHAAPRSAPYPMPPLPDTPAACELRKGAEKLGIATGAPPLLINSTDYGGRPACAGCGACVGFECPVDAKTGSHNSVIPRALATGNCDLLTETSAARVLVDDEGRATAVELRRQGNHGPSCHTVQARQVVCSAGAIESARLLLNSATDRFPQGLGNQNDQVGRNLQGHLYSGARGILRREVVDYTGPGVRIGTTHWSHGNEGIIGGGMLCDEFVLLPVITWHGHLPPGVPGWGAENKRFMREDARRMIHVCGPIQEIPTPDCRVRVDPGVRDSLGIPAAVLSGVCHEESVRASQFLADRAADWVGASDAERLWRNAPRRPGRPGGQHQAGTCRMGDDPATSVCDSYGRVHGHEGLSVIDGSLHVTNGGFNPVLTIYALAFRCSEQLVRDIG